MTQTVNNATFDCGLPDGAYMLLPGKLVDLGDGRYEMRFAVRRDVPDPARRAAERIIAQFASGRVGYLGGLNEAIYKIIAEELAKPDAMALGWTCWGSLRATAAACRAVTRIIETFSKGDEYAISPIHRPMVEIIDEELRKG